MSRVLIHYDIKDAAFRTRFQTAISDDNFTPTFTAQTESVYAASMEATDARLNALKRALSQLATDAPNGTKIFLERPGPTNDRLDIIPERIV